MPAVDTGVKVCPAAVAGVISLDLLPAQQTHRVAAPGTGQCKIRHNDCLDKRTMRARPNRRLGAAVSVLALAVGLACGGKVPPTFYYVLNLPSPAPAAEALEHTAVLMPIRAGRVVRQGRIVYRESPEQVGFYEYHRWAEDPPQSVGRSLLRHVRARGTFASVAPFDGRTRADFILRGELTRLEEVDHGGSVRAEVELYLELVHSATARVIWSSSATESGAVTESAVRSVVAGMSAAANKAISKLAGQLDNHFRAFG